MEKCPLGVNGATSRNAILWLCESRCKPWIREWSLKTILASSRHSGSSVNSTSSVNEPCHHWYKRIRTLNCHCHQRRCDSCTYSVIHKAIGLTVCGHSLGLTGTIPPFYHSNEKCPICCEWELAAGMVSGEHSVWWQASWLVCESHCYSAIEKATSSLVTGHSQKSCWQEWPSRDHSPIDGFRIAMME